jgi:hypothetical protein
MPVEIIECDQNSPEWFEARRGLPTASMFATIMAKGVGGKGPSLTRAAYMRKLAGEIVTGEPMSNFRNAAMDRGHEMEGEARDFYAFITGTTPELVGFIRNGNKGGSPDSLIGSDGLLEIKTAEAHVLIAYIEADKFPPEHMAQCQGNLWVSERNWLDLTVYWPKMPSFIKRVYRDEAYIANLASEVDRFNEELAALVQRVRWYGDGDKRPFNVRAAAERYAPGLGEAIGV